MVNVVRVYTAKIILSSVVTVKTLAVNHYQDVVVSQSVQGHLTAHITGVEVKSGT